MEDNQVEFQSEGEKENQIKDNFPSSPNLFNTYIELSQTNSFNPHCLKRKVIKLKNTIDGKELKFFSGTRKQQRLKNRCKAMDKISELLGLQPYFITFTLGNDLSVKNRELNRINTFLRVKFRRAGKPFFSTWVIELQKKRYVTYGQKALHWHFVIIAPKGSLPDCVFEQVAINKKIRVRSDGNIVKNGELIKEWGRGLVFSCEARTSLYGYLSKYLGKNEELSLINKEWEKLRTFGGSDLGPYKYPKWANDKLDELKAKGIPLNDLSVVKQGSKLNIYALKLEKIDIAGTTITRKSKTRLYSYKSPWKLIEIA